MKHLTVREHQILALIGKGKTNAEIGANLGITEKTVKNTVMSMFRKLDVRNRVEAALHHHGIEF